MLNGKVLAVSISSVHCFSKSLRDEIHLIAGVGVEGDTHAGETVQHRSRVAVDPSQPNLRQVHLIQSELFGELKASGYSVLPGELGENITTAGIDLLALPTDTLISLGDSALIKVTGLRNPCDQIENFIPGLLKEVVGRDDDGNLVRKAGIMGIVLGGGRIRPGDKLAVTLPELPHRPLERV